MALTRTGTAAGFTDPNGASVTAIAQVDGDGKSGVQFSAGATSPGLSTSYAKVVCKEYVAYGATAPAANIQNIVRHVSLSLTSLSGVATIQCKVTLDSNGDDCIWEGAATAPTTGEATATKGSLFFNLGTGYPGANNAAEWYLWAKTNAGTATLSSSTVYWNVA